MKKRKHLENNRCRSSSPWLAGLPVNRSQSRKPRRRRSLWRRAGQGFQGRSGMKISEKLFYTGTIEAWQKINITPDVGGKIARIWSTKVTGSAKGQVLAELDTEAITLQLKQAEAALAVAQASFNNAKTTWSGWSGCPRKKPFPTSSTSRSSWPMMRPKRSWSKPRPPSTWPSTAWMFPYMKAPFSGRHRFEERRGRGCHQPDDGRILSGERAAS